MNNTHTPVTYSNVSNVTTSEDISSDRNHQQYYQQPISNISNVSPDHNHNTHQQYDDALNNGQQSTSNNNNTSPDNSQQQYGNSNNTSYHNCQQSTSDNVSSPKFHPNTIFQSNAICYQNIVFCNGATNKSVLMQLCSCSSLTNNSHNS